MNLLELVAKITLDSSEYQQGLSKLGSAMGTVAKVGATAIAGATTAVIGFGASAVSAGKDFDSAMSQVGATMGFSVAELNDSTSEASKTMETLRNFAQEMGSTTAFSATEASEALNFMALAGYDAEKSMEMLPNVLNLASAGGMELARASDMVTDAETALGLKGDEVVKMVDQMAMASSKSNTSVEQLGDAILTIGANAKNVAGGTEELTTVLGILANNGIKGSEAGTHLRNVMLSLGQRSQKLKDELNVDVYDEATGSMRDMRDIMQEMSIAMADWTQEEKDAWLTTENFNKTDLSALNAMLDTNATTWDELSGYIQEAEGSAEDMAKVQLDNLEGDITLLKSAFEGVQIAVSDMLAPTFREFVQDASEGLSEIATHLQAGDVDGAIQVVGDFLAEAIAKISEKLPEVVQAGASLLEAIIQGISDNKETLTASALSIVESIGGFIIESLPELLEVGIEMTLQIAEGLTEAIPDMLPEITSCVMDIVEMFINNADKMIDASLELSTALADGMVDSAPQIAEKMPSLVIKIVESLILNAPKMATVSFKWVIAIGEALVQYWSVILSKVPPIVTNLVNKFLEFVTKFKDIGKNIVEGIWEGLKERWDKFVEDAKNKATDLLSALKNIFGIHSPSRVFREMAEYCVEGFNIGMSDLMDGSILNGVRDQIKEIQNEADGSSFDISTSATRSIDQNQNITIVLQGDADRLFRLVKEQSAKNVRLTGQPSF